MSSQGESSISKVSRSGKRQKEFDSLFYMRDSLRRQYILDRYLKRLPKGDVKLNTAFQTRVEIGTDAGDDEDLKEAYQRGWIGYQDILKYYKPNSEGVFPPNLLKRQDIIMKDLVKKTILPKSTTPSDKKTSEYKKRKINLEDKKEFEEFFKKLEKTRSTKTNDILLPKGFAKLSLKKNNKEEKRLTVLKKQLIKSKGENIALSEVDRLASIETKKQIQKREKKQEKDKKEREAKKAMKFPMWKKEQNAENYKNERYKKEEEKRDSYFLRGRPTQGLTKKEKLKLFEEEFKLFGLSSLKRNIAELKKREDARRPVIFLDESGKETKKRKASTSSNGSSRKSSVSSYTPSRKSSTGDSRKSSVSGYGSPSSPESNKDL